MNQCSKIFLNHKFKVGLVMAPISFCFQIFYFLMVNLFQYFVLHLGRKVSSPIVEVKVYGSHLAFASK